MKRCFKIVKGVLILFICLSLLSCGKNNSSSLSPLKKDSNLNEVGVFPVCKEKITPPLSAENEGDIYYIVFINALG